MHARTFSAIPAFRRKLAVAGGVVLLHVGALWALQSGLLHQATEVFVPVAIVTEIITPPLARPEPPAAKPEPEPTPPKPTRAPEPPRHAVAHKAPPAPAPKLTAAPEVPPAPNAPTGVSEPQPAPPPVAAPVAAAPAPAAAPAARVELPVSDADYLHNPKPAYPPASRRLGEKGKVVLRVLIGPDGTAQDATVLESSGYDRLDRTALAAVRQWRYVPGKRGGVPEPMWVKVPINFDFSD
jgi:periplasmic protein TonB